MTGEGIAVEIREALDCLPAELLSQSGSVFYTGKQAFRGERSLYLLGLNPGGDPVAQESNTVARHIREFQERRQPWSAYADESWEGAPPGTWGMQPRILHMLARLHLDPLEVPASNVVFARSRSEADLRDRKSDWLDACWPVHETVIESLGVRTLVCFGGTVGYWVRERLGAHRCIDTFQESNAGKWTSQAHLAEDGRIVVTVTHPGRAEWRNPAADPTGLVRRALGVGTVEGKR